MTQLFTPEEVEAILKLFREEYPKSDDNKKANLKRMAEAVKHPNLDPILARQIKARYVSSKRKIETIPVVYEETDCYELAKKLRINE